MTELILASTSPRRKELLEKLRIPFTVVASDYEEDMSLPLEPSELARTLSRGKAEAVADRFPESIVLGADTFVVLEGHLLGKPHTPEKALSMLQKIGGQWVSIITGYTVMCKKTHQVVSKSVETRVLISSCRDEVYARYVATGEPLDKAGAFALQGLGAVLIERIEGDFYSAVGLPLYDLAKTLLLFNVPVL